MFLPLDTDAGLVYKFAGVFIHLTHLSTGGCDPGILDVSGSPWESIGLNQDYENGTTTAVYSMEVYSI